MITFIAMIRYCFLLSLLLAATFSIGQQPVFYNYSTTEGLPSSEAYDILQDSKGYIWIATDRGASRFDGYTFKNFTTAEGLTNNTVLKIYEDAKGRIWFLPITAELCYYENGKIIEYKYNSKIKEDRTSIITSFLCNEKEELYIGFIAKGLIRIDNKGNLTEITEDSLKFRSYCANFQEGRLLLSSRSNAQSVNSDSVYFTFNNDIYSLKRLKPNQVHICGIKRKNGSSLIYFNGYIAEIDNDNKVRITESPDEIIRIYEDKDSCLWIGLKDKGVRKYKGNENLLSGNHEEYLVNKTITCIYEDHEKGVWLTSLADGMFYTPDKRYKTYYFPEKYNITSLERSDNGDCIYAGFSNGWIMEISNEKSNEILISEIDGKYIYSLLKYGSYLFVSSTQDIAILKNGKFVTVLKEKGGYSRNPCVYKNYVVGTGHHSIYAIDTSTFNKSLYNKLPVKGEIIFADSRDNLWLGDHSGLYIFSDSVLKKSFPGNKLFEERVSALGEMEKNRLIVATIGSGLVIIEPDSSELRITKKEGLSSDIINCMSVKNNHIWLGTNNGISHIEITGRSYNIRNYNISNGLPGNEIIKILYTNKKVWAATRKELVCFNPEEIMPNTFSPAVYITSVSADKITLSSDKIQEVRYDAFPLKINFTGLSYKMRGNVLYRYRLQGLNNDWQYTTATSADFLSLPQGQYIFEVAAQNEDDTWSDQPATFSFTVIPPFWKTAWFIVLVFFLIVSVITLIAYFRIRSIKKRNKLMTDLLTYRQQALTMQMSPHFIFNSLNSIQSFIMTEEKKLATKYISKFARLMRRSLENSRNEFILLSEETEVLNLYLELECLRFKNLFSFRIETDPSVDPDKTFIPSMLVQPFVENCVKHAFIGQTEAQGEISIIIKKQNEMLICEIEDNGIGINASLASRSGQGHVSAGLNITENRLKLISESLGQKFMLIVKDKQKEKQKGTGTIVTFAIPYKTHL